MALDLADLSLFPLSRKGICCFRLVRGAPGGRLSDRAPSLLRTAVPVRWAVRGEVRPPDEVAACVPPSVLLEKTILQFLRAPTSTQDAPRAVGLAVVQQISTAGFWVPPDTPNIPDTPVIDCWLSPITY